MDWSHLPSRAEVANSAFANDDDNNNNNNNSLTTEINGVISERVSARLGKIKMTPAGPEAVEKLEKERIARDLRAKKFGVPLKVPDVLDIVEPTEVKKVYVNTELENKPVELFSKEAFEKITKRAEKFDVEPTVPHFDTAIVDVSFDENAVRSVSTKPIGDIELSDEQRQELANEAVEAAKQCVCELQLASVDAEARPKALYVHGVDNYSTDDIFSYFTGVGGKELEWINDSSCVLLFDDQFAAQRACTSLGTQITIDDQTFYVTRPFGAIKKQLLVRAATVADKRVARQESQFYAKHLHNLKSKAASHNRNRRRRRGGNHRNQSNKDYRNRPY